MTSGAIKFFISRFGDLIGREPQPATYYQPRPYRNAIVRFRKCSMDDFQGRLRLLETAGLNAFLFPSQEIPGCDLLSDSGTATMTMEQWSQMLLGDEAYGSNEGYYDFLSQIETTFGPLWRQDDPQRPVIFIFHQGRAAEHALFTILRRELGAHGAEPDRPLTTKLSAQLRARIENRMASMADATASFGRPFYIIPSNSHFDTTEANIEDNNFLPLNLPCREHEEGDESYPFRGNMHLEELEDLMTNAGDRVPLIYVTITNNTGGGQPVSMANIRAIREIADAHNVPFFIDACRFAENAWFIHQREAGYREKSIEEIVHEMFEYAGGFHISLKKDGLANIGGALVLRKGTSFMDRYPDFGDKLNDHQILTEGHPTYGGMAGRDLKAIVEGLRTTVKKEYLAHRIHQVERFGRRLRDHGIPVLTPTGGHAVYIDLDQFFEGTDTKDEDFKGLSLTALLLLAGHRLVELGLYAFGKHNNGREIPPDPRVNTVRAAVPRLAYEDQDLFSVAEAIKVLHEHKDRIPGVTVTHGRDLPLRHFKSRFRFKPQ
jgi:tryptophanase